MGKRKEAGDRHLFDSQCVNGSDWPRMYSQQHKLMDDNICFCNKTVLKCLILLNSSLIGIPYFDDNKHIDIFFTWACCSNRTPTRLMVCILTDSIQEQVRRSTEVWDHSWKNKNTHSKYQRVISRPRSRTEDQYKVV